MHSVNRFCDVFSYQALMAVNFYNFLRHGTFPFPLSKSFLLLYRNLYATAAISTFCTVLGDDVARSIGVCPLGCTVTIQRKPPLPNSSLSQLSDLPIGRPEYSVYGRLPNSPLPAHKTMTISISSNIDNSLRTLPGLGRWQKQPTLRSPGKSNNVRSR